LSWHCVVEAGRRNSTGRRYGTGRRKGTRRRKGTFVNGSCLQRTFDSLLYNPESKFLELLAAVADLGAEDLYRHLLLIFTRSPQREEEVAA
jgi:hypothetical protein